MLNEVLKTSADIKTYVKQQEIKDLEVASFA